MDFCFWPWRRHRRIVLGIAEMYTLVFYGFCFVFFHFSLAFTVLSISVNASDYSVRHTYRRRRRDESHPEPFSHRR